MATWGDVNIDALEFTDGVSLRVDGREAAYLSKAEGWTVHMMNQLLDVMEPAFAAIAEESYENGYKDAEADAIDLDTDVEDPA